MLLSDQRTARWVLLGEDHMRELERRIETLRVPTVAPPRLEPPTISLKGLTVHLQSAFKLAATLEDFANSGNVAPFEEITPICSLTVSRSTQGVELKDSDNRVALTPRETRKWAGIIRAELARLNASQIERGGIRTVFADGGDGRWILQWGDEVFVSSGAFSQKLPPSSLSARAQIFSPVVKQAADFVLLLSPETGACVALTDAEVKHLQEAEC
ncbi:MAG: hypothetical protein DMF60_08110 [Acidobacteria bacterium]|nr:MAG: hypothetical protein DMF60_08110 [Acidobacteriota bacterium]